MKNKKFVNNNFLAKRGRTLLYDNNSQIIVITGVLMVLSVIFISSLSPDIANIGIAISNEKATTNLQNFISIKKTFPYSLTYNLAENITLNKGNNKLIYYGNIDNMTAAFNKTRNEYRNLEMENDVIFDAKLNDYWVAHPGSSDCIYYLDATLELRDNNEYHVEDVVFSIVCYPII